MSGKGAIPLMDDQGSLFEEPRVVGYQRGDLAVREIHRDIANDLIRKNHYSKKVYAATTIHLGVFWRGDLLGALQYGFAMNPSSQSSVVKDTAQDEYLELNRMWLDDVVPRNGETASLALSWRYLRSSHPRIAWIQSFADERCGGLGVVYQAANFTYCGEHMARFWELDGVIYHNSLMTRDPRLTPSARKIQEGRDRATAHDYRQFRYVKFLKPAFRKRLLLPVLPYPKRAEGVEETPRAIQSASVGAMPTLRFDGATA